MNFEYSYTYNPNVQMSPLVAIVTLVVCVLMLAAVWRIFAKAGEPGWCALIPIVNTWKEFKIVTGSGWKMFFMLIPLFNIIYAFVFLWKFSKAFGHGLGMFLLLLFCSPLALLILGFGRSRYYGPRR